MSTTFYFVRHGQTDWNIQRRYQGQMDIPLNEIGIEQAKIAAAKLAGQAFDALYCSDLTRAVQTAAEIEKVIHLPVRKDPRLREIHQGEWQGLPFDEVFSASMYDSAEHLESPALFRPPGGEAVREVAERVWSCLEELAGQHKDQRILVVSHGLAIATALCKFRNLPLSKSREIIPDNCEMIIQNWQ
jgi:broad specificity phosphatase PhoE